MNKQSMIERLELLAEELNELDKNVDAQLTYHGDLAMQAIENAIIQLKMAKDRANQILSKAK